MKQVSSEYVLESFMSVLRGATALADASKQQRTSFSGAVDKKITEPPRCLEGKI